MSSLPHQRLWKLSAVGKDVFHLGRRILAGLFEWLFCHPLTQSLGFSTFHALFDQTTLGDELRLDSTGITVLRLDYTWSPLHGFIILLHAWLIICTMMWSLHALTRLYEDRFKPCRPSASNSAISKCSRVCPPSRNCFDIDSSIWQRPEGFTSQRRRQRMRSASALMATSIIHHPCWDIDWLMWVKSAVIKRLAYRHIQHASEWLSCHWG